MNKVVLYVMNEKGLAALNAVVDEFGSEGISSVVSSRDKNVVNDFYSDIAEVCDNNSIQFYDRKHQPQRETYGVAVGWRWMLDSKDLIIMHDSLLPKYRGFAPLVSSLINKESRIGVSAIFAEDTYDTGDIIKQVHVDISYPIKIQKAIDIIKPLCEELAVYIFKCIRDGFIPRSQQDNLESSYSVWRDKDDYIVDWASSSEYIRRFVDSVGFPYGGALTYMGDIPIRILEVEEQPDVVIEGARPNGKIIFMEVGMPTVICGTGLVKIKKMVNECGDKIKVESFRTRFK